MIYDLQFLVFIVRHALEAFLLTYLLTYLLISSNRENL